MIGHPDHELLFIGKQVADAAGLHDGSNRLTRLQKDKPEGFHRINSLPWPLAKTLLGPRVMRKSWLITESTAYTMLLRGHAPQSEPFRKWVTEEVLPSIRKTGSYDIAKSETPEGLQFAEEFGKLRAEIGMLANEVKGLREVIAELRA